jgi:hypothetical protein
VYKKTFALKITAQDKKERSIQKIKIDVKMK